MPAPWELACSENTRGLWQGGWGLWEARERGIVNATRKIWEARDRDINKADKQTQALKGCGTLRIWTKLFRKTGLAEQGLAHGGCFLSSSQETHPCGFPKWHPRSPYLGTRVTHCFSPSGRTGSPPWPCPLRVIPMSVPSRQAFFRIWPESTSPSTAPTWCSGKGGKAWLELGL